VTERDFLLIPKKKEKGKLFFLLFSLLDMTEFFVFLFKRQSGKVPHLFPLLP
jgi:hypothetical protein